MSRTPQRVDVLIVGSGFAGSLLARGLVDMGLEVLVVDRGRHPRFALGESTTPLGNLALERLALRFGWRDVWNLACWGRLRREHSGVRCGLKRGFSFYSGCRSSEPVLVAASPDDEVADTQWLRADVDQELCRRARQSGAVVLEEWEVIELALEDPVRAVLRPTAAPDSAGHEVRARFLVDASGAGRLLQRVVGRSLGAPLDTSLVYGHLQDLPRLESPNGAPYSPSWSAVHHLVDCGWMYELRFDDDVTSCGVVIDRDRSRREGTAPRAANGDADFSRWLEGAPLLRDRVRAARPVDRIGSLDQIGWRVEPVVGANWARLPHSVGFIDPMFSTGIAWSLLGVERLLDVLTPGLAESTRLRRLQAYGALVDREFDHLVGLLEGARATWSDLDALGWYSMVYFAAASFAETQQRLDARLPGAERFSSGLGWGGAAPWSWCGFLGADDGDLRLAVQQARQVALDGGEMAARLSRHVPEWVESRNVAGLADARRHPWYAVDLDSLLQNSDRIGLTVSQVEAGLPRLLGKVGFDELMGAERPAAGSR